MPLNTEGRMELRKAIDGRAASAMGILLAPRGTQQVAIKLAEPSIAPLLQVGLRPGIAAVVVLVVILIRREQRALGGGIWLPGLIVGLLFAVSSFCSHKG